VRNLAAEGQIEVRVALAYSPDRLSREYPYQILLMEDEELARPESRHCL
jgi:hypothetical protein